MTEARFQKSARLRRRPEFELLLKKGRRQSDPCFTILSLAGAADADGPRLGLIVPRKQVALAVERNRIKRIVRESFRQNRGALPQLDMVVMVRSGIAARKNAELRASLAQHWLRLGR
ncbi:MAG: ribonuclease P protein component [Nevskiales bacterium]